MPEDNCTWPAKMLKITLPVMYMLVCIAIAAQIYWLSRDIVTGDQSYEHLIIPLRYSLMRVPQTEFTSLYAAKGRLCADFAQIYFPSQNISALREAYSQSTTLDPWLRPSRYPPPLHFICSFTLCKFSYGTACLVHLAVQLGLFLASFTYVFLRLGLKKYLLPSLLFVNTCFFLTPVGLSWFERGQFSLYVALCYLWMMLAVMTGDKRYFILAAVFGFVKWTTFPFIFVILSVYSFYGRTWLEFRERLTLSTLCCGTIMVLFLTMPNDGIFFLKGLFEQELSFSPSELSLASVLPRFVVKILPFLLVTVGLVSRRCNRQAASYLLPFFTGSAILLTTFPTWAYDYSVPCLTAFVPYLIYWAKSTAVERFDDKIVLILFGAFLLGASYASKIFNFEGPAILLMYIFTASVLISTLSRDTALDKVLTPPERSF